MIKINLLPQKKRAERSEASQMWLVVVLVLFIFEAGGLFVFHGIKSEELKDQNRKNAELKTQIETSKRAVANHTKIKQELEQLRAREDAIAKLQSARTGPTAVMLELARILTPGRGPSVDPDRLAQIRKENPLAVYNPGWDARRLWLTRFVEQQRKVRLEGVARDGEDVSELARRMNLSSYFFDVRLLPAKTEKDKDSGLEVVRFQLEAQVRY
ncbi:MAG: PilN domain-containing protein [Myxococcales bacterium]|nr:PilN domain-containing protein [Myxococcales bacterium]MCB9579454.1 PilN domain-containing protein [Polyangiaceae bacterium]